MTAKNYLEVEDLEVYTKLCRLAIGAENSRARAALADIRGINSLWHK